MPGARTACPSCGASVRPGATFCGQCYADFRPAPTPPPVPLTPAPSAAYGVPAADPLTAPLLDVVLPQQGSAVPSAPAASAPAAPAKATGWPCSRCEHLNALTDMVCGICGAPFLASVAEDTKVRVELPLLGDLSRYGRGQRAAIAFGVIVAILVPLAVLTLLMTHAPAKTPTSNPGSSTSTGSTGGSTGSATGSTGEGTGGYTPSNAVNGTGTTTGTTG